MGCCVSLFGMDVVYKSRTFGCGVRCVCALAGCASGGENFITNTVRRNSGFRHTSMVNKEQPKVPGLFRKNFKRGKSIFFATYDVRETTEWKKVSCQNRTEINQ